MGSGDNARAVEARAASRFTTFVEKVPVGLDAPLPYVIISVEPGVPVASSLDGVRRELRSGFYIVLVSDDPLGCHDMADAARALFQGWRSDEEGWDVWEEDLRTRPEADEQVRGEDRYVLTLYFRNHTRS